MLYVYHVVTEREMELNQVIEFNENTHSGVYNRVYALEDKVLDIYNNPDKYKDVELEYPVKVALREFALEEVRSKEYNNYPSRLNCLYVSSNVEDAEGWANYFIKLNRKVFQLVKLEVDGNSFIGDANNCFEGSIDKEKNISLAYDYWNNIKNKKGVDKFPEMIVDGKIKVVEIIKTY